MPVEQSLEKAIGSTERFVFESLRNLISCYTQTFELDLNPILILNPSDRPVYSNEAFRNLDEIRRANIVDTLIQPPVVPIVEGISLTVPEAIRAGKIRTFCSDRIGFNDRTFFTTASGIFGLNTETNVKIIIRDITELEAAKAENQRLINFVLGFDHDLKNMFTSAYVKMDFLAHKLSRLGLEDQVMTLVTYTRNRLRGIVKKTESFPDQLATAGELRKEEIDIIALLQELSGEDAVVTFKADRQSRKRLADPEALESIFINLIKNAKEAGANEIEIRYSEFGNTIRIHVKDNGKGIPADKWEKIFEKGESDKPDGNGIGLYDVVNRLAGHQGTIKVIESVEHAGSTLEVVLPILERTSWKQ